MKKLILLCLFLFGCGGSAATDSQGVIVSVFHVDQQFFGNEQIYGKAVFNEAECHIYILTKEELGEWEYTFVLGHEIRHCFEGSYHE